ncbi:MAG: hypothetical protein KF890_14265 [Nitrospira sp.]|nr:hypothetical protein [Nitrospira sp.]
MMFKVVGKEVVVWKEMWMSGFEMEGVRHKEMFYMLSDDEMRDEMMVGLGFMRKTTGTWTRTG